MILIDSNIPMYLAGGPHPNKANAVRILEKLTLDRRKLVTDAGVLQEILHRYVAIDRRDAIQPAFDAILHVVDEIFGVDQRVVTRAKEIVLGYKELSARDAIHLAVMESNGVHEIFSFDRAFDVFPKIIRLG